MVRFAGLTIMALSVAACAQTSRDGDRQAVAVPPNYRALAAAKLRAELKDPYSVRDAAISEPTSGFVGLVNGGTAPLVCTRFNSKNSFGAYTGVTVTAVTFSGGQVASIVPGSIACTNARYAPFPELEGGAG